MKRFLLLPLFCWRARIVAPWSRNAAFAVLAMLGVQLALGITTLIGHVPLNLAATHQAGAMVLFALLLRLNHVLRLPQTVNRP